MERKDGSDVDDHPVVPQQECRENGKVVRRGFLKEIRASARRGPTRNPNGSPRKCRNCAFSMAIPGTPRRRVKLPSSTRAEMTARRRTISANAGGPNASFTVGGTVVTQSRP